MALIGKIIAMTGVANIVNEKGESRALTPGDQVQTGDSIQTAAGVTVDVQLTNGRVVHISPDQLVAFTPELAEVFTPTEADSAVNVATIDSVIDAIESGRDINEVLEATAAGAGGAGSDGSHSAVFLDRINQTLSPLELANEATAANAISPENSNGNLRPDLALFEAPAPAVTPGAGEGIFVESITPGVPDTSAGAADGAIVGARVPEGTDLQFQVNLNTAVPAGDGELVTLTLSGTGDNPATIGTDTNSPTTVTFSDGTTGTLTPVAGGFTVLVPPGATGFTVNVPTNIDATVEGDETLSLGATAAGNTTDPAPAIGTIIDPIFVATVEAGTGDFNPSIPANQFGSVVTEGDVNDPLQFAVGLSNTAPSGGELVTLTFNNGDGVDFDGGTLGVDTDTAITIDFGEGPVLFNPVEPITDGATTYTYSVLVPEGIQDFVVLVPTSADTIVENPEEINFTAATANSNAGQPVPAEVSGRILDDTPVFVEVVSAGLEGGANGTLEGSRVLEGDLDDPLNFGVTLNKAPTATETVTLTFSKNTADVGGANADIVEQVKVDFGTGALVDAVLVGSANAGEAQYTVDVPAGTKTFSVIVQTVSDSFDEVLELLNFTASTQGNSPTTYPAPTAVEGGIYDADVVVPVEGEVTGLTGEYFGYNDTASGSTESNRFHEDDGDEGNLDQIKDIENIIDGRNGSDIVGTAIATGENVADLRFNSTELYYGLNEDGSINTDNDLGRNVSQAAGEGLDPTSALAIFLGQDGATDNATVQTGSPDGASSGIGDTTDSIIRLTGSIFIERGSYDFRVTADDGFRLKVGGETLLEFDGNQFVTTREYTNLSIDNPQSGLTSIELIYWEQGTHGVLHVEFKSSNDPDSAYQTFSLDNLAMMGSSTEVNLADNQELVNIAADGEAPNWVVRSGTVQSGSGTLTGGEFKDVLTGSAGIDTLNGAAGADTLMGAGGGDILNGGAGSDKLDGGTGADTMTGGTGDDHYIVDNAGDITVEEEGEGTDTVEFVAGYAEDVDLNTTDFANIENVTITGAQNVSLTGNAADNQLTGGAGSNTISGGAGDDHIIGGKGSDTLTGGAGKDVFEWNLADAGAVDVIKDFEYTGNGEPVIGSDESYRAPRERTDSIDLRDLLQGEDSSISDVGNLLTDGFLEITFNGADTVIDIRTGGGTGAVDQQIVLEGVDLYTATGATDPAGLLQNLLANGTLIVD